MKVDSFLLRTHSLARSLVPFHLRIQMSQSHSWWPVLGSAVLGSLAAYRFLWSGKPALTQPKQKNAGGGGGGGGAPIYRIALTGGPCGGKSSALDSFCKALKERKF